MATSGGFAARVVAVDPPGDEHSFVVAVVQLTNATEHPVTVDRYVVDWAGGSAGSDRDPFVVPPGASVWRRLDTRSYDAKAVRDGRVTVETDTAYAASVVR